MIPVSRGRGVRISKSGKGRKPIVYITEVPIVGNRAQSSQGWPENCNTSQLSHQGERELGYVSTNSHQSLVELLEGGPSFPALLACSSAILGLPEEALGQRTAGVVDGKAGMHGNGENQGDIERRGADTNSTCYQSYTKN